MAGKINIKKTVAIADGGDASVFRPSDMHASLAVSEGAEGNLMVRTAATDGWELLNYVSMNRNNATGGTLSIGDVVALDENPDVVTDDTDTSFKTFVVAQASINNGVSGLFGCSGPMTVKVTGTVTALNYASKAPSATTKSLQDTGVAISSPAPTGAVGFFLTGGSGTVTAFMFGYTVSAGIPSGTIAMYGGSSAPTGWLICDGAAVSRSGANAALFAAIGTTWGTGDGSTTFNLPDLRGRAPIGTGQGSGLTNRTLAATSGAETHQLVTSEIPAHTHTTPAHAHAERAGNNAAAGVDTGAGASIGIGITGTASTTRITTDTDGSGTSGSQGSDGAHNNMQPFAVVNFIIKQ